MSHQELTSTQLNQLIKLLKAQQKQLQQQIDNSETDVQPVTLDQQSVGRVSRIDAIQQQQMAIANREQDRKLLIAIRKSLVRVDNDEYGYCLECAEPVGFARLEVQPQAEYCVRCQEKMERT